MPNIVCSGPGPHVPVDGILGTSDAATIKPMLCPSVACQAANVAAGAAQAVAAANDQATSTALNTALARLTQIKTQADTLAAQNTAWTIAQQKAVASAISDMALIERQLIRRAIGAFDGST